MAKPRQLHHDRPNPRGPGDGADEADEDGEGKGKGRDGEGGGGKERAAHDTPSPTHRSRSRHREGKSASAEREEPAEEQDPKGAEEEEEEDGETPRGAPVEVTCVGGGATSLEENVDLLGFHPDRAHLLLQGVYGNFPHHNYRTHLERGVADDTAWQRHWRRLAAQSASWYATPSGAVGRRFTAILAAEWRGVLNRICNSERPLVFAHFVLTKTLGIRQAREIRARITRRMDRWEMGQHAGLVGDAEAEGAAREGRAAFSGEEEDDAVARSFQETVLSGKLRQAIRRATNREGGGCLLPGDK